MVGLQGTSRPPICNPTHSDIRKSLAVRELSYTKYTIMECCLISIVYISIFSLLTANYSSSQGRKPRSLSYGTHLVTTTLDWHSGTGGGGKSGRGRARGRGRGGRGRGGHERGRRV